MRSLRPIRGAPRKLRNALSDSRSQPGAGCNGDRATTNVIINLAIYGYQQCIGHDEVFPPSSFPSECLLRFDGVVSTVLPLRCLFATHGECPFATCGGSEPATCGVSHVLRCATCGETRRTILPFDRRSLRASRNSTW